MTASPSFEAFIDRARRLLARGTQGRPGASKGPRKRFLSDRRAISETVSSILMVGVSVTLVGAVSVAVVNLPTPSEDLDVLLRVKIAQGLGGWGEGDETIRLEHRGGPPIDPDRTTILVTVNGQQRLLIKGQALDGNWTTTQGLAVGQTWTKQVRLDWGSVVHVQVSQLIKGETRSLLDEIVNIPSVCSIDDDPPTVVSLSHAPPDLDAGIGSATFTFKATDAKAGVDNVQNPPELFYRFVTSGNPAYLSAGTMTKTVANTFTLNAAFAFASHVNETFQYKVAFQDLCANEAESAVQSDLIEAASAKPDLSSVVSSTIPAIPGTGDATRFVATIYNNGTRATMDPFVVRFEVNGTQVGADKTVTGAIPINGATTVQSDPWLAVLGTHAVRVTVDVLNTIAETDESNNVHDVTITITGPSAVPLGECGFMPDDPGFAFVDTNNDGRYTALVDLAIDPSEIVDGVYQPATNGWGIVIPASFGAVNIGSGDFKLVTKSGGLIILDISVVAANKVQIDAGGLLMVDGVSLVATNDKVNLEGSGGTFVLCDLTVIAKNHIDIDSNGGALKANRTRLTTTNTHIELDTDGGDLWLMDATLTAKNSIKLDTNDDGGAGNIHFQNSTLIATNTHIDITADGDDEDGGDLHGYGATISAKNKVDIESHGGRIDLRNGNVSTTHDHLDIASKGGWVRLDGTTLAAKNKVDIESKDGRIDLANSTISTTHNDISIKSEDGDIHANDAVWDAKKKIHLKSYGIINLARADLDSASDKLEIESKGPLDMNQGSFEAAKDIEIESIGDIDIRNAVLRSVNDEDISFDLGGAFDIYVEGVEIHCDDDEATAEPDSVNVIGNEAHGRVIVDD